MPNITSNNTQTFKSPEFGRVRATLHNGDAWFVGKDVAEILGYSKHRDAIRKYVDESDRTDKLPIRDDLGRTQRPICVNEFGAWSLIEHSGFHKADRFKHWITSGILPKVFRSGETDTAAEVAENTENAMQLFNNPEFGKVRVVDVDGEPWLVGKDVAEILGYKNSRKAIKDHVSDHDKTDGVTIRDSIGREQKPICINESGLYSLVMYSKLPAAEKFKHWVTSEVLTSIRKHGGYIAGQNEMSDMELLSRALLLVKNQLDDRNRQIEEMQPKVIFADAVETSSTSVLIGDFAKLLKQNGIDIGQTRLFEWMRNNGYLMRVKGERRNMPTQRSMEMKLFEIKESVIEHKDGHLTIIRTPKVTGKGQIYFANKFLQNRFSQE